MRKTQSLFGWTMPSRKAVREAEKALDPGEQGVRDEIGFLYIHDAYVNRFFPGTSVLQTRLRYALFVPWIYRRLLTGGVKRDLEQELTGEELSLVARLSKLETKGVIGRTIYPRATKQPSTFIYWSALGTWGILRDDEGATPSRAFVHRMLEQANQGRRKQKGEFDAEETYDPFWPLPDPPKSWNNLDTGLSFTLGAPEREFMHDKISNVQKPGTMEPSLLASLAKANVAPTSMYSNEVANHADIEDRSALKRARSAAALGAIGRAVYAALLEEICENDDRRAGIGTSHRDHLFKTILPEFRDDALRVDLFELRGDVPKMPDLVFWVLEETCKWLENQQAAIISLRDVYANAEYSRKQDRARLPSRGLTRDRRNEWHPNQTRPAEPLHYRWQIAQQFLTDLNEPRKQER